MVKNVQEEREAPWQHTFGCMDLVLCVPLNISLWLEVFHMEVLDGQDRPFVFAFTKELSKTHEAIKNAAKATKALVCQLAWPLLVQIGMESLVQGLLGSHSMGKFASMWARLNGTMQDKRTIVVDVKAVDKCQIDATMSSLISLMLRLLPLFAWEACVTVSSSNLCA